MEPKFKGRKGPFRPGPPQSPELGPSGALYSPSEKWIKLGLECEKPFIFPGWAAIIAPRERWEGQALLTGGARAEVGLGLEPNCRWAQALPWASCILSALPVALASLSCLSHRMVTLPAIVTGAHWCPAVRS